MSEDRYEAAAAERATRPSRRGRALVTLELAHALNLLGIDGGGIESGPVKPKPPVCAAAGPSGWRRSRSRSSSSTGSSRVLVRAARWLGWPSSERAGAPDQPASATREEARRASTSANAADDRVELRAGAAARSSATAAAGERVAVWARRRHRVERVADEHDPGHRADPSPARAVGSRPCSSRASSGSRPRRGRGPARRAGSSSPISVWLRTNSHSSAVRVAGFSRIASGIASLPMSWSSAASLTRAMSNSGRPSSTATVSASSGTPSECRPSVGSPSASARRRTLLDCSPAETRPLCFCAYIRPSTRRSAPRPPSTPRPGARPRRTRP